MRSHVVIASEIEHFAHWVNFSFREKLANVRLKAGQFGNKSQPG